MAIATNLGFPRVGKKRELKFVQEKYWADECSQEELVTVAESIRKENWHLQSKLGIEHIPANDFSFYDQMLDMAVAVGAIPERFKSYGHNSFEQYFAMARGVSKLNGTKSVSAMEMTKWFDTNYHYLVPEFDQTTRFEFNGDKILGAYTEAKNTVQTPRPVIIGPATFLLLGKYTDGTKSPLSLWESLVPVYERILDELSIQGAAWVQIDEPCLSLDQNPEVLSTIKKMYTRLAGANHKIKILLTTYFDGIGNNLELALNLPVSGIHLDLVRAPAQLDFALKQIPSHMMLSLGLIDGRNIWKSDLTKAVSIAEQASDSIGADRIFIAPSCSLLHCPYDVAYESKLDEEMKNWLSFSTQKLEEVSIITKGINGGRNSIQTELNHNHEIIQSRKNSSRIHNPAVKARVAKISSTELKRHSPFDKRRKLQQDAVWLPILPTTTIGSFPQTKEIRSARSAFKGGKISEQEYNHFLAVEIQNAISIQEKLDIDVLVHGEAERNDMVEYFGEKLEGFAFTQNGWVQSYGSRCVKPPVIFGDVSRPEPMTVQWAQYAQSLTSKPVKGMLTGPVTILQWSFVRDDQPRETTCKQIAFAIRDEVKDLEQAGIKIIQIDEPAVREGLPLRQNEHAAYLRWAVDSFRLASAGVRDDTQIHTHMCYCEFNDILHQITEMDADVISIETSRSHMELLDVFAEFQYPNDIGPGVYDIHSPRIPTVEDMTILLRKALSVIDAENLWVNPDCGLKTRRWEEVIAALEAMVKAVKSLRNELQQQPSAEADNPKVPRVGSDTF